MNGMQKHVVFYVFVWVRWIYTPPDGLCCHDCPVSHKHTGLGFPCKCVCVFAQCVGIHLCMYESDDNWPLLFVRKRKVERTSALSNAH